MRVLIEAEPEELVAKGLELVKHLTEKLVHADPRLAPVAALLRHESATKGTRLLRAAPDLYVEDTGQLNKGTTAPNPADSTQGYTIDLNMVRPSTAPSSDMHRVQYVNAGALAQDPKPYRKLDPKVYQMNHRVDLEPRPVEMNDLLGLKDLDETEMRAYHSYVEKRAEDRAEANATSPQRLAPFKRASGDDATAISAAD